jgi:hypothetical protein
VRALLAQGVEEGQDIAGASRNSYTADFPRREGGQLPKVNCGAARKGSQRINL